MQPEDRPLSELVNDLMQEMSALVRQEVELARTEVMQKAVQAGQYVALLAVGGALGYGALLALIAAVIMLLREAGLPSWLSALLVGLGAASAGAFLAWKGIDGLRREDLAPRQTIETLKESKEWAKAQTQ
jgi:hypothetical protein